MKTSKAHFPTNFSQVKMFDFIRRVKQIQLINRAVSLLLITALLAPFIFFGQPPQAIAKPLPKNPKVKMPEVLLTAPEPFQMPKANPVSVKNAVASSPSSFASNIWSEISDWFGLSTKENSNTEASSDNSQTNASSDSITSSAGATFTGSDLTTKGNWIGNYGSQGYEIIGDSNSYPSWLQFSASGQGVYTYAASTADPRGLVKATNNNDRVAAVWHTIPLYTAGTQFDLAFNFTDGQTHQLALYIVDWDNHNLAQSFEIIDPATGNVLDTRPLGSFSGGAYIIWQVTGQIIVRVKNSAGSIAGVVQGIFIDPPTTPTPTPTPTNSYNAVVDFSSVNNPAGTWSYGYKTTLTSAFTNYPSYGQPFGAGIDFWLPNANGDCCPTIAKNTTGTTQTYVGTAVHPADLLNVHPGPNGEKSTLRWTAPAAGSYQAAGRFQGIDTASSTTDVHILHNNTEVWANNLSGYGSQAPYNLTLSVNAGDVIEFLVGFGSNNSYSNDSTGLEAIITPSGSSTPTPTPTATPTPTPGPTPPPASSSSITTESRQRPINETGGTNLYSRNFGWGTGLAGLSGRGVNAGFGISYNSLIWIKQGNDIVFNPNNDNAAPGFRFGYPVIEPSYTDSLTGKNTYLMVTPSGGRVAFRQLDGSADTFETADSSYAQLKAVDANTLLVTGTGGAQMLYELKGGSFKCSQIKDSNGNYITINHDSNGLLQSVTDTLGRVISVSYDSGGQPLTITQARQNGTHKYATFTYADQTINTNFQGLNLVGINNGAAIKVLQKITFADQSYAQFDYNSYGQVYRVSNYAADGHKLNHTATNLDTIVSQAQSDAPRFSQIKNWAENFNLDAGNQPQEVVIPIDYLEGQSLMLPNNTAQAGTLIQVTTPDGTVSKTLVGNAGWMEALPILTEDWINENGNPSRKRWSWNVYTQDDPNLSYILNPRTTETKMGDATNVRRTTIDYHTQSSNAAVSLYGLVREVKVYDADQTTVLKRSTMDYNLDPNYLSRRIIGLPFETKLFDQSDNLMSKVTYAYDEGNFGEAGQNISPIQHDSNYNANFVVGRGNLTSTTRWDALAPTDAAKAVTARVKYNTAGLPVAQIDPLNRAVSINYADSFEDNQNRNTFAYPTVITDPAGNSSMVKYRFDIGANVYAASPAPAGNTTGKTTSRIYDALGRLEKETVNNTGVYTRYEYPNNGIQSRVFSTVTDVNNNGAADAADEILSESFADGAGRTRMTRAEHPGSQGGWSGSLVEYDVMGRVKRSSVPTEVNLNWQPAGDDATRGWLWTAREYDWKGRTTKEINTDGTDKLLAYDGCGCAGGQVTTIQGELVARDDQPSVFGRRTQKIYEDILGRAYKSETLKWDGSVYSTTRSFFNGRDQAYLVRQFAGAEGGNTFQDTTMTFDGHGRLKTQHRPEQDGNVATVFDYNADDTLSVKTDGRGATATYTYDNRKLVTNISYAMTAGQNQTPAQTNNYSPTGALEGVDTANRAVWGWTLDPDSPNTSNAVQFYIGAPAGQGGTFVGSVTANQSRPDVNQQTGQPGNHGFKFDIPNSYANGVQQAIYAYGIDNGSNNPTLLSGSPKYFTFGTAAPAPAPAAPTGLYATNISQSQIDVYWNASPQSENVTGYNLRINGSQVISGITYISYPVTGLAAGTTYTFEVQAVNSSGNSAWSQAITATTASNNPPTAKPDLVAGNFTITPATIYEGDSVNFSVTVTNQGSVATPNDWIGVLYLIDGHCPSSGCVWAGTTTSIGAGQSVTLSSANVPWTAVAGQHTISLLVDDQNRIDEANENNNTASQTVFVNTLAPTPTPTPGGGGEPCYGEPPQICPINWSWDASVCSCVEGGGGEMMMSAPGEGELDPPDPNSGGGSSPIGWFDGVNTTDRTAVGWSFDPDSSSSSNVIHFYVNGPAGSGTYIGSSTANEPRPDVNQAYNIQGNHGFKFQIPLNLQNGNQYTIYAYGLDTGSNPNTHLSGSPKTFSFSFTPPAPQLSSSVSFTYDALGNRTSMTDSAGTQVYEYDQLSRLKTETRSFADNLPDAPLANNSFKLQYNYSLSGQLQSLTDPFGEQINYGHDKAGRLQSVTGTEFGGVTTYAASPRYRAWGGLQNLSYGNGTEMSLTFDNKLQASSYNLSKNNQAIMQKSYEYYADGSLRYVGDQLDNRFDRFNKYDFAGRITEGRSGAEARGLTVAQNDMSAQLPYRQSYQYDAFSNLTQRDNKHWGVDNWYGESNNLSYTYQNNRIAGYTYDADGRTLVTAYPDEYSEATYEATGQLVRLHNPSQSDIYRTYDGSGREVKRRKFRWQDNPYSPSSPYGQWVDEGVKYFIRSSLMGNETISEVDKQGKKIKSFVKAAGATIATQNVIGGNTKTVSFEHWDASGMSYKSSDSNGVAADYPGTNFSPGELDPMGNNMGTETPYQEPLNTELPPSDLVGETNFLIDGGEDSMMVNGQRQTCAMDGMAVSCSMARRAMDNGSAIPASIAHLQGQPGFSFENRGLGIFTVTTPRMERIPNANYGGNGTITVNGYSNVWLGRTDSYLFSFNGNFGGQQQTQTRETPREVLDKFLINNQACLDAVQAAGKRLGLKEYKGVIANVPIMDGRYSLIGNLKGFGLLAQEDPSGNKLPPLMTFNQYLNYRIEQSGGKKRAPYALTTPGSLPSIWVSWTGMAMDMKEDGTTTGGALFHETLHAYFRGKDLSSHQDIVSELQIDFTFVAPPGFESITDKAKRNGIIEGQANTALNNWINNSCSNVSKPKTPNRR